MGQLLAKLLSMFKWLWSSIPLEEKLKVAKFVADLFGNYFGRKYDEHKREQEKSYEN